MKWELKIPKDEILMIYYYMHLGANCNQLNLSSHVASIILLYISEQNKNDLSYKF